MPKDTSFDDFADRKTMAYRRKSIAGQWKIKLPFPKDAGSWG